MDYAFQYIEDNGGIDTEDSYQYEARDAKCRYNPKNIGATDTGYTDIAQGDENKLKKAVASQGPIAVAIDASQSSFHSYRGGVYYDPRCDSEQLNHAVSCYSIIFNNND